MSYLSDIKEEVTEEVLRIYGVDIRYDTFTPDVWEESLTPVRCSQMIWEVLDDWQSTDHIDTATLWQVYNSIMSDLAAIRMNFLTGDLLWIVG